MRSKTALLECDKLPPLEDIEIISSNHIQYVAQRIQGGAGLGGCNASHWQDANGKNHSE